MLLVVGGIAAAGCLEFGAWAEKRFGKKDCRQVVADEVAGQSFAMLFLPWREINVSHDWVWNTALALVAFFSFRAMDIIKPPPARIAEQLKGGEGILVDDLIAGFYALCITQAIGRFALEPVLALTRG
jgi:phosphatidylglycerophosphatase A